MAAYCLIGKLLVKDRIVEASSKEMLCRPADRASLQLPT